MLLTTLRYGDTVRQPSDDPRRHQGGEARRRDDRALAEHIIDKKQGKFDPSQFEDKYEDALLELIRAKKAGKKAPKAKASAEPVQRRQSFRRAEEEPCRTPRRESRGEGVRRSRKPSRGESLRSQKPPPGANRLEVGSMASLEQYHAKRDFKKTAEPAGKMPGAKAKRGRRHLRHPQACRHAAALRSSPGAWRRAVELGGDARPEPRSA